MTSPTTTSCPSCGAPATGNFCSTCGGALAARACAHCQTPLSAGARFCHRCGQPVGGRLPRAERTAWITAAVAVVALVGAIVFKLASERPRPQVPDMANPGAASGLPAGAGVPLGRAPDISNMTPTERFNRLFDRVMGAAERGDSATVVNFTPMALGAYAQLDTLSPDARYHAAVLHLQLGRTAEALALADTILGEAPGHLFGFVVRAEAARIRGDSAALARARREFLARHAEETRRGRVEYREHEPVLDQFKREAEASAPR
ncbi:MAG TPA: zinc ribbon domain-containing protein [Gemmatimonadales bacterium]|nr:zinc ribbon domain-containing protein [Gemmatimonadales bacterium]